MKEKWIAVVGSPRSGKNTDLLTDYIIEVLNEKNIQVDKFILDSRNISTCSGCECCMEDGKCVINDGVSKIIDAMKNADGFILASPSYNYNVTAQMKAFLDRTFCLYNYEVCTSRLSQDKNAIVIGVCRGRAEESMGYTIECMCESLSELGVNIYGRMGYFNTKHLPVEDNGVIKENIGRLLSSVKKTEKFNLMINCEELIS